MIAGSTGTGPGRHEADMQPQADVKRESAEIRESAVPATGRTASGRWNTLRAELRGQVGRAITDYGMIADGDRVMVCVSGGKDSSRCSTC